MIVLYRDLNEYRDSSDNRDYRKITKVLKLKQKYWKRLKSTNFQFYHDLNDDRDSSNFTDNHDY